MAGTVIKNRTARLGDLLIQDAIINEQQLQEALEYQSTTSTFLGETLVTLGMIPASVIGPYLETVSGFPFVDLSEFAIDIELAKSLPEELVRRKMVLPFACKGDTVKIAMADPLDLGTVDDVRARLNKRIMPYLALEADLEAAINKIHDSRHKAQLVLDESDETEKTGDHLSVDELVGLAEDAPIVRLLNSILFSGISSGTSDIHIEPQETVVRVRFRQDGLLYDQMIIPRRHMAALISRVKIISHLNIAERRRPQDGRFKFSDDQGSDYDMRVSLMPCIYGEKVVMRILEKNSSVATKEKLGLFPEQTELFDRFVQRPHGIVLVTGPTGSGKSTTLYVALNQLNDSTRNINTVEDPVEYNLVGVNQVQVNPKIGVTFSTGLRTLVRQDPDVIMVGEIRDKETAETAVQAALTGHLVLSTLHTNDAPGSLVRLQNMGVEPFLISSAVIGVIGQRLIRTLCVHCKETRQATQAELDSFGLPAIPGQRAILGVAKGCPKCGGRGMKGRTAVYEFMPMSEHLRDMVLRRSSGAQLYGQAVSEGMVTMRDCGLRKVMMGVTTIDEVTRVLFAESSDQENGGAAPAGSPGLRVAAGASGLFAA